jgi:hypothetical protein
MSNGKQRKSVATCAAQVAGAITASAGPSLQASRSSHQVFQPGASAGWAALALAGLLLVSPGCTPRLDPETYGEVVHTLPVVERAEEPFPLPELIEVDKPKTDPK